MSIPGKVALVEDPQLMALPIWRETLTGVEYLKLKTSLVYYGIGVPHGHKEPVILVPGFLGADIYLLELYFWLRRMGYRPYLSGIGHVAECPDILTRRLLKTVDRAYTQTGQKVHLIGHSLGGVLARGAACIRPDQVASVITLASPFRGVRINSFVLTALRLVRKKISRNKQRGKNCFTSSCACGFSSTMRSDFPCNIPQTAVYTKTDGIVDWKSCLDDDPNANCLVNGTHIGLAWNAEVYRIIAERLSEAVILQAKKSTRIGQERTRLKPIRESQREHEKVRQRQAPVEIKGYRSRKRYARLAPPLPYIA